MTTLEAVGSKLPGVARTAIRQWLAAPTTPSTAGPIAGPRAPVFVTLRNPDGSLRGCVGSVVASQQDVVQETRRSAVLAASRDPRFPPVTPDELGALDIEVSVLFPEEPISGVAELDPKRHGVVVRDDQGRQGLLLPDIDGVDDAETQVSIARRKAGIPEGEGVRLSRFEVVKWREGGGGAA